MRLSSAKTGISRRRPSERNNSPLSFSEAQIFHSVLTDGSCPLIPPQYFRKISKDHRDKMSRRRPSCGERFRHKSAFFLPVAPPIHPAAEGITPGLGILSFRFLPGFARSEKTTKKSPSIDRTGFQKTEPSLSGNRGNAFSSFAPERFLCGPLFP